MKRKLFKLALLLLLLGIVFRPMFFYRLFHPLNEQDLIQKVFENRGNFDVMMSSQQVTAQLLHRKDETDQSILAGYGKDAPVPVSADEAQKVKDLLKSPSSYLWDIANTCIPDYGVLFNFRSGRHVTRVAFCFRCNMVGVFDGEDDNARQINAEYIFEPMRKQLVALCKSIFPDDKEIQALN